MKALSIKQPFPFAIFRLGKDVENRRWNTKFRGRIIIHSPKSVDADAMRWITSGTTISEDMPRGCLVGEVDIVDCVPFKYGAPAPSSSKWAQGPYLFCLRNPVMYKNPIPYKGALGLFDVELSDDALEEARG